jgi:chemotaxis protein MotB
VEQREKKIYQILHIKEAITAKLLRVLKNDPSYKKRDQTLDFATLDLFAPGKVIYNKNTIKTAAESFIKYIDVLMGYRPYITKIIIEGHSDSTGDAKENLMITQERAEATKKYFLSLPAVQKYHIGPLLHTEGKGDTEPVLVNGVEDKNASRRISVRFELNPDAILEAIDKALND